MDNIYMTTIEWFNTVWNWEHIGSSAIRILAIFVIGRLSMWLLHKTINRIVLESTTARRRTLNQSRRMTTIGKLLNNITTYTIYFITFMLIFSEFGINLGPLLAGAGVVGLAIGFGAQSLVKDILTGFFIIMEDQFAVGDVIQTGKFKGTVEVIGLRTTKIVSWTGEVHILPNSMVTDVTNYSIKNSLAVVDIAIPNTTNADEAIQLMKDTMEQIHHENLIKEPEVLGVQTLTAAEMTIRIIAECRPNAQSSITRLIHKHIKEALHEREGTESGTE